MVSFHHQLLLLTALVPFQTLQEIYDYDGFELKMEEFILDQPLYKFGAFPFIDFLTVNCRFLECMPGGRSFGPNPNKPASATAISAHVRVLAKNANLPCAGIYAIRRDTSDYVCAMPSFRQCPSIIWCIPSMAKPRVKNLLRLCFPTNNQGHSIVTQGTCSTFLLLAFDWTRSKPTAPTCRYVGQLFS
jgi:hypothetical protein